MSEIRIKDWTNKTSLGEMMSKVKREKLSLMTKIYSLLNNPDIIPRYQNQDRALTPVEVENYFNSCHFFFFTSTDTFIFL